MAAFEGFDPGLFGAWSETVDYRPGPVVGEPPDEALMRVAKKMVLEVKSAEGRQAELSPDHDMRRILNEVTQEMRKQFEAFRALRGAAEAMLVSDDEAAQKLGRADIKAATDAMSMIVRTLEKIDALQRQFARDRQIEAERVADEGGYEAAKARFMKLIEERANERAFHLYEAWQRDGPPADLAERFGPTGQQREQQ